MEASDAVVSRVQKALDALKQKNTKLAEENARLKQEVSKLKSSNSRIRRIPKKPAEAAVDTAATATTETA